VPRLSPYRAGPGDRVSASELRKAAARTNCGGEGADSATAASWTCEGFANGHIAAAGSDALATANSIQTGDEESKPTRSNSIRPGADRAGGPSQRSAHAG